MTNESVVDYLRRELTEPRTDAAIDNLVEFAQKRLPAWFPTFIVRRVLDALLPEGLVTAIEVALRKKPA